MVEVKEPRAIYIQYYGESPKLFQYPLTQVAPVNQTVIQPVGRLSFVSESQ